MKKMLVLMLIFIMFFSLNGLSVVSEDALNESVDGRKGNDVMITNVGVREENVSNESVRNNASRREIEFESIDYELLYDLIEDLDLNEIEKRVLRMIYLEYNFTNLTSDEVMDLINENLEELGFDENRNQTNDLNDFEDNLEEVEEKRIDNKDRRDELRSEAQSRRDEALKRVEELRRERELAMQESINNDSNRSRSEDNDSRSEIGVKNRSPVANHVHSLISLGDISGGIGSNVSEFARDMNNSVNQMKEFEERINNRGRLMRTFFGGDNQAAQEIENRVEENREKINRVRNLLENNEELPEEVSEFMKEEIENLESEQERLKDLAENEKSSLGILGRFFRN